MSLLDTFLAKIIRNGTLTVTDHKGQVSRVGTPTEGYPDIAIRLADAKVAREVVMKPELGGGEAYMDHRLIVGNDDIMGLLSLLRLNSSWERGGGIEDARWTSRVWGKIAGKLDRWNWNAKSKRNVAHHYDLDDRLYDLFLDENRQYSCGYFTDPANSLDQAQRNKMAHIAAKLDLRPGMRVLDIGCGWGGTALYLNRVADVDVLGVTLSEEQLKVARRRAEEAGVSDRVKFELIDYRKVEGKFDRIVSIGMFEHVGAAHFGEFFATCKDLLADDGVMLLHTIGKLGSAGAPDPFTDKWIFPGYHLPSISEMFGITEKLRLIATDVEILRRHYAYTLRHWLANTDQARPKIVALYDERFFRMWEFYLAAVELEFLHGSHMVFQMLLSTKRDAVPITRDFMVDSERAAWANTAG